MVNKKKKTIITAAVLTTVGVLCAGAIYVYITYNTKLSYKTVMKSAWGISLPDGMKRVYEASDTGFTSDGVVYSVFELKEEPSDFINGMKKSSDIRFQGNVESALKRLHKITVPGAYLPVWENIHLWKQINKNPINKNPKDKKPSARDVYGEGYYDHLYMIYFPNSLTLIVCRDCI